MGASLEISSDDDASPPPGGTTYLGSYGEALWAKKKAYQSLDHSLEKVARWISTSRALLVGAGAGMGVDSGLGTYRGARMGVWPPLKELGIDYREICTPDSLAENPQLTWAFWRYCIIAYRNAEPHEGYQIIQNWAANARLGGFCYTTNVDAMWPRIFRKECVYEVHGSTEFLQCTNARGDCPGRGEVWPCPDDFTEQLVLEEAREDLVQTAALPGCPSCGKLARPNVNMFGDFDFSKKRHRTQKAQYKQWLQIVDQDMAPKVVEGAEEDTATMDECVDPEALPEESVCEEPVVCLEIGAGTSIPTVRTALETRAMLPGHVLIRINPENCALSAKLEAEGRAVVIPFPAAEGLRLIHDKIIAMGLQG